MPLVCVHACRSFALVADTYMDLRARHFPSTEVNDLDFWERAAIPFPRSRSSSRSHSQHDQFSISHSVHVEQQCYSGGDGPSWWGSTRERGWSDVTLLSKIGPFVTTGNWDWTHVNGKIDVAACGSHRGLQSHLMHVVDEAGNLLAYPPLHYHHGALTEISTRGNLIVQKPGEWGCTNGSQQYEQASCVGRDFGQDHAKALFSSVGVDAIINDVRPPSSEPLTWFLYVSLQLRPITRAISLISMHALFNPHEAASMFLHGGNISCPNRTATQPPTPAPPPTCVK